MYSCKLTIISTNASTGDPDTKDFNGVNQNYIAAIGYEKHGSTTVEGVELPASYTSFWEWANAVARGINSLTTGTYNNCRVQAVFDINQEVA